MGAGSGVLCWVADEGAVLGELGRGRLERALRRGRHAVRHVGGARPEEVALGRAEVAVDALDLDGDLVGLAAVLRVLVVRRRRGRRRHRRRGRPGGHGLGLGVRGRVGEAAHVGARQHVHVAVEAPGRAPAVLDRPVLGAGLRGVADDQHAVVELGAAGRVVEDARLVQLPLRARGVDGDRDGLLGDGVLERVLVALGHVGELGHGDHRRAGLLARARRAAARRVRVGILSAEAVGLDPLEGVVHQAAVAALVLAAVLRVVARDQILHGGGHGGGEGGTESVCRMCGA